MTTPKAQAVHYPTALPKSASGMVAVIGVALAAALAAIGSWISSFWVAGALFSVLLFLLLIHFPRLYVYLYVGIGLLSTSVLEYLDSFRFSSPSGASANLLGILWALTVPIFLAYVISTRRRFWKSRRYRPFLLLILAALPAIFLSSGWANGLHNWIHLSGAICLSLILFWNIKDRATAIATFRHILLIFAAVMATGFYQLATGTGSYDQASNTYRLSGTYGFGGEVSYAVLLLYLSCLTAPLVMERTPLRSTAIPVFVSSTFLLVASQSRAPLLAFLAAAGAMLSKSAIKLRYWVALLIVILAAAQLSPRVYARFGGPLLSANHKFWQDQQLSVNATQRMATWVMLYGEFVDLKTFLVGHGFGFVDHYLFNDLHGSVYSPAVHNEYLRLLLDVGIAGVGLLLWQLWLLYRVGSKELALRKDPLARSFGTSLCGMVVGFAVVAGTSNMYGLSAQSEVFWVFTGLLLSAGTWKAAAKPAAGPRSDGPSRHSQPS
jgi:O-Antigen ligase